MKNMVTCRNVFFPTEEFNYNQNDIQLAITIWDMRINQDNHQHIIVDCLHLGVVQCLQDDKS